MRCYGGCPSRGVTALRCIRELSEQRTAPRPPADAPAAEIPHIGSILGPAFKVRTSAPLPRCEWRSDVIALRLHAGVLPVEFARWVHTLFKLQSRNKTGNLL